MFKTGACVWTILVSICLGLCLPGCGPGNPESSVENSMPEDDLFPGWTYAEIASATPPYTGGNAYVLAWTVVNDGGLRIESCLVLRVLQKDDGDGKYCLSHLYRHPTHANSHWRVSWIHESDDNRDVAAAGHNALHSTWLKRLPDEQEFAAALRIVDWTFDLNQWPQVVGYRVCTRQWERALGRKPDCQFRM